MILVVDYYNKEPKWIISPGTQTLVLSSVPLTPPTLVLANGKLTNNILTHVLRVLALWDVPSFLLLRPKLRWSRHVARLRANTNCQTREWGYQGPTSWLQIHECSQSTWNRKKPQNNLLINGGLRAFCYSAKANWYSISPPWSHF